MVRIVRAVLRVLRPPLWVRQPVSLLVDPVREVSAGAMVALLLAVVTVVGIEVADPGWGFAFYAVVPVVLAAFWFGRSGALLTAAAGAVIYPLGELLRQSQSWHDVQLWLATANRLVVFSLVAITVAGLLDRDRRYRTEIDRQKRQLDELGPMREALIPAEFPHRPGLELATAFVPVDGSAVGDFLLVMEGPVNSTTIVVGDVVGHGFEAARRAAFVRAVLATFAPFNSDPAQLLQLANTALTKRLDARPGVVTAVGVNITPIGGRLSWACAGRSAPWLLDTGEVLDDGRRSVPLGLRSGGLRLTAGSRALAPGSGFLLFSNGLTQGRSARGVPAAPVALFGEEGVRDILSACRDASPDDVVHALGTAVKDFAGGDLADEVRVVACRLKRDSGRLSNGASATPATGAPGHPNPIRRA